jgi:hypothetical protein
MLGDITQLHHLGFESMDLQLMDPVETLPAASRPFHMEDSIIFSAFPRLELNLRSYLGTLITT